MARRPAHAHLAGQWEFPGGKIEAGETPEEALARELSEELAIEVLPGALWGILFHRYPEKTVRIRFIFAKRVAGSPEAIGCEEFRWVLPPDLLELPFPEADRPLVDGLVRAHREGRSLVDVRKMPETGHPPPETGEAPRPTNP